MRALCLLRDDIVYRKDAFNAGLEAAGYKLTKDLPKPPKPDDLLVIWNRYGSYDEHAKYFEACGAKVIVVENGHLGKDWLDGNWYSLALNHHGGAGHFVYGGPERWDSWGVVLQPWKTTGDKYLIFEQRGIGVAPNKSPPLWAERIQEKVSNSRIRRHPRGKPVKVNLQEDLHDIKACITWNSAAANFALIYGVPVFFDNPVWIGARAGSPFAECLLGHPPKCNDHDRLEMFRRMAWAMWDLKEVETGVPFKHLCKL